MNKTLILQAAAAMVAVLLFVLIVWVAEELLGWDSDHVWSLLVAFLAILGGNAAVRKLGP